MYLGYFFNCVWLASEFELLLSHGSSFINPSLRRVQCATQLDRLVLYHMCCDVEKSLLSFLNRSSCVMERGYDRSCPEADWLAFAFFKYVRFHLFKKPPGRHQMDPPSCYWTHSGLLSSACECERARVAGFKQF